MLKNLRYRLAILMQGRYGSDQLSRFLSILVIVLIAFDWIANAFLAFPGVRVFVRYSGIVYAVLLFVIYFRTFSRNIPARQRENRWFVKFWKKITFGKGKVRGEFQNGRGGYGGYGNGYGSYGGYQNNSGYSDEYSGFGQSAPPPKKKKAKLKTDRDHCFRICPECMVNLRLPKKKGKHTVVCPRCKHRFEVKI